MKSSTLKSSVAVLLAALVVPTLVGCNKEEQAKAEQEKAEQQAKAAEAQREADSKKAESAQKEAAEIAQKAEKDRAEARASIQKDVDAADRKAADLKERAAKLKGNAKLNADAASTEFTKRRTVVEKDLEQLSAARGEAWDKLKEQTEKDVDAVEAAVDSFDKTVSSKT